MSLSVDAPTLEWAMKKLAVAFPASFGTEEKAEGTSVLWRELLDQHPWITRQVFATAVYHLVWAHKGDFVPGPAVALDFFREAERKTRAAAAQLELERLEGQQAALTAGPESNWGKKSGPERAAFLLRHLAIGKLRARTGATDLNVPHLPPDDQLATVEEDIRRTRFMRRSLVRLAAGNDVSPTEFAAAAYPPTRRAGK